VRQAKQCRAAAPVVGLAVCCEGVSIVVKNVRGNPMFRYLVTFKFVFEKSWTDNPSIPFSRVSAVVKAIEGLWQEQYPGVDIEGVGSVENPSL